MASWECCRVFETGLNAGTICSLIVLVRIECGSMWGGAAVAGMSHVTTLQEAGAMGLLPAGRKEV